MTEKGNNNHSHKLVIATVVGFFSLFLYGFIDNLKGPTLPLLLLDAGLNYTQGGAIQQGAYFGFLISTLITGVLTQRYSHRAILILASICIFIGSLSYSFSSDFLILLIAMTLIGTGLGFLDLIGIRLIIDFNPINTGKLLNLSAFFHGFASMLAPLFAGMLIGFGFTWSNVYQSGLIVLAVFIILIIFASLPKKEGIRSTASADKPHKAFSAFRDKKAWVYYVLIMSYESIEIGIAVWLNEYLQTIGGQSDQTSISLLSIFFLCLMLGRLAGSLFVERIGYLKMLLFASLVVVFCLSIGIFGPPILVYFLPLSGFFLASIFPTATAAASKDLQVNSDMSFSLFFTFAGLGGMIGSWVVGRIADLTELRFGFAFLILMAVNITVMTILQMRRGISEKLI